MGWKGRGVFHGRVFWGFNSFGLKSTLVCIALKVVCVGIVEAFTSVGASSAAGVWV